MWIFFPNTLGLPLEEVAAKFGDAGSYIPTLLLFIWSSH